MKCKHHATKDATGACTSCGNLFCETCLLTVRKKQVCKECAGDQLAAHDDVKKEHPQIVITQTNSQQVHGDTAGKPRGSWGWLCFWIIVCFPIAIFYYFAREWK